MWCSKNYNRRVKDVSSARLHDYLAGKDLELDWVLKDIKKN
jgi:hypothetical protein